MADTLGQVLKGRDVISARQGMGYMHVGDKIIPLVEATKIKADITKKKEDVSTLGTMWKSKKTTSIEGSGSFEYYFMHSNFIKYAQPLIEQGVDFYFDLTVDIEDKSTKTGKQSITLHDVNMDKINLFDIEADDSLMKGSTDFDFVGVDLNNSFND